MIVREREVEALLTFAASPDGFCRERGLAITRRVREAHRTLWAELYRRASRARPTVAQTVQVTLQVSPRGESWRFKITMARRIERWLREGQRLPLLGARQDRQRRMLYLTWTEYGSSTLQQLRRRISRDLARFPIPVETYDWLTSERFKQRSPEVPSSLSPGERIVLAPVFAQLEATATWPWHLCRSAGSGCGWFVIQQRNVRDCLWCRQAKSKQQRWYAAKKPAGGV